jgi:formylglycine-generating enzyme required for sulfatase activity
MRASPTAAVTTTRPFDADWGRGKRPVVNVSWDDAQTYISWLKRKTGRNYHH